MYNKQLTYQYIVCLLLKPKYKVRLFSLLMIFVILGACNYNAPQPATAASSSVAVEQIPQATPKVYFAQATPIPTQVFLGEEKVIIEPLFIVYSIFYHLKMASS